MKNKIKIGKKSKDLMYKKAFGYYTVPNSSLSSKEEREFDRKYMPYKIIGIKPIGKDIGNMVISYKHRKLKK